MLPFSGKNWDTLKSHVETIQSDGIDIPVLSIEGLLLTNRDYGQRINWTEAYLSGH